MADAAQAHQNATGTIRSLGPGRCEDCREYIPRGAWVTVAASGLPPRVVFHVHHPACWRERRERAGAEGRSE